MKNLSKEQLKTILNAILAKIEDWSKLLDISQNYVQSEELEIHQSCLQDIRKQTNKKITEVDVHSNPHELYNEIIELENSFKEYADKLLAAKFWPVTAEIRYFRNEYLALIAGAKSLVQVIQINKVFFSENEYVLYLDELNKLSRNDEAKINDILLSDKISNMKNMLLYLQQRLNKYRKDYHKTIFQKIAPRNVVATDRFYNHPIRRVCYRSDSRPPITDNGEGVFQTGFSKTNITSSSYLESLEDVKLRCEETIRVSKGINSNQATCVAVSKSPQAAAFFPKMNVYNKVNTQDVLLAISNELKCDISFYFNQIKASPENVKLIKKAESSTFNLTIKHLLCEIIKENFKKINSPSEFIGDILKQLSCKVEPTDIVWLYVVYIAKGYDVHSRSYLASFWKSSCGNKRYLFSQEICTDEIPTHHVLAAIPIKRDFTDCSIRSDPYGRAGDYRGEAYFSKLEKEDIQYNQVALSYLATKDIPVEKYKKHLENFFGNKVNQIDLSADGYMENKDVVSYYYDSDNDWDNDDDTSSISPDDISNAIKLILY